MEEQRIIVNPIFRVFITVFVLLGIILGAGVTIAFNALGFVSIIFGGIVLGIFIFFAVVCAALHEIMYLIAESAAVRN